MSSCFRFMRGDLQLLLPQAGLLLLQGLLRSVLSVIGYIMRTSLHFVRRLRPAAAPLRDAPPSPPPGPAGVGLQQSFVVSRQVQRACSAGARLLNSQRMWEVLSIALMTAAIAVCCSARPAATSSCSSATLGHTAADAQELRQHMHDRTAGRTAPIESSRPAPAGAWSRRPQRRPCALPRSLPLWWRPPAPA